MGSYPSAGVQTVYSTFGLLKKMTKNLVGTPGGVMVSKLDEPTFMNKFESHWATYSYGPVLHLSKKNA